MWVYNICVCVYIPLLDILLARWLENILYNSMDFEYVCKYKKAESHKPTIIHCQKIRKLEKIHSYTLSVYLLQMCIFCISSCDNLNLSTVREVQIKTQFKKKTRNTLVNAKCYYDAE
jgi:hypothetical protein